MLEPTVIAVILAALTALGAAAMHGRLARESRPTMAPSPRCARDATADADRGVRGQAEAPRARVFYDVKFQVADFVAYTIAWEGGCDRWRDRTIVHAYRAWARDGLVEAVPDAVFLAALARHPNVKRTRERLKDANGRVIYLPTGTPMRGSFYTISERAYATVPQGVAMPRKAGVRAQPKKAAPQCESGDGVRKGPARVQGRPRERIAA